MLPYDGNENVEIFSWWNALWWRLSWSFAGLNLWPSNDFRRLVVDGNSGKIFNEWHKNTEVKVSKALFIVLSCAECLLYEKQVEPRLPRQCCWKDPCIVVGRPVIRVCFSRFLFLIRCPLTVLLFTQQFIPSAVADVPKLFLEWNLFTDVLIKIITSSWPPHITFCMEGILFLQA